MAGKAPRARALVVDDDAGVRCYLEAVLLEQNCAVTLAESGDAALALLADGKVFDLVFTDYSMPGHDGVDVLKAVRERLPKARAVLMSASFIDRETREIAQTLADEVLVKPVTVETLVRLVDRLLGVAR